MQACGSSLTALAIRFAEELRTHFVDVMERLEELWMIARNNEAMYTQSLCGNSPTRHPYGADSGSQSMHYGYPGGAGPGQQQAFYPPFHPPHLHPGHPHLQISHPGSPRSQPPPLPSCPPPPTMSGTYMGRYPSMQGHLDGPHVRADQFGQQTYVTMDGDPNGGEEKKKSGSVLGRFLRNIPFRRSNRKGTYKQHQADTETSSEKPVLSTLQELLEVEAKDGDLNAYEISMSDEDRVALMVLVKEGKISTQTALAVVQKFEEEKKKAGGGGLAHEGKENVSRSTSSNSSSSCSIVVVEVVVVAAAAAADTPSKKSGKKKKGTKPPKSQSTFSADDPHGASLDPQRALGPGSPPCEHQLYRQRRVHSLGQLDLQAQGQVQGQGQMSAQQQRDLHLERIGLTRAISCTTACGPPGYQNHRSASCSTGDDGISSDDNENGSRKLQTFGGSKLKQGLETKKGLKPRDTKISRPPLLKQQSAPVGPMSGNKGPFLGQAKSLVDYSPGPSEVDFVALKKGEIIHIMNLAESGVWWGTVNGRQGKVRFEHVEVVIDPDKAATSGDKDAPSKSVSDLLHKIGLGHLTGLFMLNGYDDLDIFSELDDHDLSALQINDPDQRSKLLSAAQVLGDWSEKNGPHLTNLTSAMDSPSSRAGNSSCDSGCYAGSDGLKQLPSATAAPSNGRHGFSQGSHPHPPHHPCKACGKPKQQSRKLSAPAATGNPQFTSSMVPISPSALAGLPYYPTGQYPTMGAHGNIPHRGHRHVGYSPYVPGQYPGQPYYPISQQLGYPASVGGVYPYGGPHGQISKSGQSSMPASRTLTDMSVTAESANSGSSATTPTQGGANIAAMSNTASVSKSGAVKPSPTSSSTGHGDRASLTEEDKEIIAITYGKSTASTSGRLTTPLKSSSAMSQPIYRMDPTGPVAPASSNITMCTMYVPGATPGYSSQYGHRVDGISMFDNPSNSSSMSSLTYSCSQCAAAYASCPECFPPPSHHYYYNMPSPSVSNYYRHYYVNTSGGAGLGHTMGNNTLSSNSSSTTGTMVNNSAVGGVGSVRSDSKSSKMSLSSTCTQTTCLSPDHDDSAGTPVGTGGVSTFIGGGLSIDSSNTASSGRQTGHYAPGLGHYGPATQQPLILHPGYAPGPGRTMTPLNRGTPVLNQTPPTHQQAPPTMALADPSGGSTVGLLSLHDQVQPPASASPAPPQEQAPPPPEWIGKSDGSGEGPGMARLYTRGKSQTPESSDKSVDGDSSNNSGKDNKVKSPTRSLMPLVSTKLSAERINLTDTPYSSVMGHCGIPPLLVQRYSEELRQETDVMALVLEQLRERQLRALGRPCIQNEQLSQSCRTACDLQISSVQDFLTSIGLPMYFGPLSAATPVPSSSSSAKASPSKSSSSVGGVSSPSPVRSNAASKQTSQPVTLERLLAMSETELEQATGADARHLRRIVHALGWVQLKLGGAQGPSSGATEQEGSTGASAGKVASSGKAKATAVTDKV
ncbi:SAM and SH3 domain-containing protein 3 [Elysia marginata]|uniref:SAM and SH3 domain-containing protein 3 n=1 Tax=Elysia marginata TaxID=1093978 RepID=A0AAV4ENE5_9GAST|nr:SAM and SH3 domain-containing protein 3 [Elysia marginata]